MHKVLSRTVCGLLLAICFIKSTGAQSYQSVWGYKCVQNYCQKTRITNETKDQISSLGECRIFCAKFASIWPRPTGKLSYNASLAQLNINSIDVLVENSADSPIVRDLINRSAKRFKRQVTLVPTSKRVSAKSGGKSLEVTVSVKEPLTKFHHDLDESYTLNLTFNNDRVLGLVKANNFFGARHALETLSQLVYYDELRNEVRIPVDLYLEDGPKYTHRGILLDTSRNYISVDAIKRTLEGMASSKLNVFHWHLTDSHSFPYVSQSAPELSRLGAYSSEKIYTVQDVREIVEYARERGIFVLPEFDAPAHVGEGWQDTGLLACFDRKPWQEYCVEPPCGQLDPTKPGVYKMLKKIYKDMVDQFDPTMFHMGGDEVNENCWHSEPSIVDWMDRNNMTIDEPGFMRLWDHFQTNALDAYKTQRGHHTPIIIWTSKLTSKPYLPYLDNDTYIIQIWTTGQDQQVKTLLKNNFRVILSNYDALYFDCGFSGWVADGHNWCAPYIGWQKVYENAPKKIAGDLTRLVLGSEATLWTEQVDDTVVDARLWPRAAAMAETLWSEPNTSWKEAEDRFVVHRDRLVQLGIQADAVQPDWCKQHQNACPLDGKLN